MADINPPLERLSSNGQRKLARGAVRQVQRCDPPEVAGIDQVRNALRGMEDGKTIALACRNAKIRTGAFWRRVLNDPELKRELAATLVECAYDMTKLGAAGNASVLAVHAKLSREMGGSLSPSDWGDKVQVENRSLVIHTNLDFSLADSLDGIIQGSVIDHEPAPTDDEPSP